MALGVSLGLEFSNGVVAIVQRARKALLAESTVLLIGTSDEQRLSWIGAGRINEMLSSSVVPKACCRVIQYVLESGHSVRLQDLYALDRNAPSRLDGAHKGALEGRARPVVSVPIRPTDNGFWLAACSWRSTAARGEFAEENEAPSFSRGRCRTIASGRWVVIARMRRRPVSPRPSRAKRTKRAS